MLLVRYSPLTNKGVIVFSGDDVDVIFELLLEADVDVDDVEAEEGTITAFANSSN